MWGGALIEGSYSMAFILPPGFLLALVFIALAGGVGMIIILYIGS